MDIDAEMLEEELKRIRDQRAVKEMTPYGPVLDAPKVSTRQYHQAVLNDPSSSVSARRQARMWLASHKPGKGVKGNKHYMVKRKKKRAKKLHEYWCGRMMQNHRLFKWKKEKKGDTVLLTRDEYTVIATYAQRNYTHYGIHRKDKTLPWQWDNLLISSHTALLRDVLDVQRELKRPDAHHTGHPEQ